MLIKLPILINGKKYDHLFKVEFNKKDFKLLSYSNEIIVNILCVNNNCITIQNIYLPLTFELKDNIIYNENFFYLIKKDNSSFNNLQLDFYNQLLDKINKKLKKKLNYINKNNLSDDLIKNIYEKYSLKYKQKHAFNNIESFLYYNYNKIIFYLNWYCYYFESSINDNNKIINLYFQKSKKVKTIINKIYEFVIIRGGKNVKVSNIINKDNYKDITKELIIFNYLKLSKLITNSINKNNYYNDLFKFYINKNQDYLIYLKLLDLNINKIEDEYKKYFTNQLDITKDNISFELFKIVVNKDTNYNINLINNLMINYENYPYNIIKKKLDITFKKIIYYSFKFISDINLNEIKINIKIKKLYTYFISNFKKNNCKDVFFNNINLYSKSLYIDLFKIIFFVDNFLDINNKEVIKNFNNNLVLYNISCKFNFLYLNEQLDYYKFYFDKTHIQNIFIDIIDKKIRDILKKPYLMFNYINDKLAFINWTVIIRIYISQLFYQPIKIKADDIINLSELMYACKNIKQQNIQDSYYFEFICLSNKYKHLVIYNDRINLKINDIYLKKNINMGHLVKDIKYNNKIYCLSNNDNQIIKYKLKYLKYKTKYLENNLV